MVPVPAHHPRRCPVELSVVIAARDAAVTLGEQLDALEAQEWDGAWEVLVVDNGSTDATCAIVRQAAARWPALRLVEATAGVGPAYARNAGARLATGRSLAFCDADDVVAPGWIAAVGAALRTEEFVCGPVDIVTLNPPWLAASRGTTGTAAAAVFEGRFPFASSCNLGIRRDRFLDANGFDEDLLAGEDIDLSMRLFCAGIELAYVDEALVRYRYRPTLRSTFDRAVAYGRARPLISERWRARRRGEDAPRWRGARNYAWLVRHAPLLTSRAGRARWLWVAGQLVGTVVGSRRVRRLYL
jgi:glycosyltransferase involved in cell wall biosynthesis